MKIKFSSFAVHAVLAGYTAVALSPIILVIMNSMKARRAIFLNPLVPPGPLSFDLIGYHKVFADGAVGTYYMNSIFVTLGTIGITVLFGAMAGWALSEYKFRFNKLVAIYLAIG